MAKDHYLPAAFIGRFSQDTSGALRNRHIWVNNGKAGKILSTTPSSIGYKKGLYALKNGSDIDKWNYEGLLNRVLTDISNSKQISLDDWLRVAVPFVTGLYARGKEFNKRYEAIPTIKHLTEQNLVNPDNTNGARAMRLQRLLGPVTAARWVVLHSTAKTPIITNDLGLTLTKNLADGDIGWAIPLDRQTVLGIFPRKLRNIGSWDGERWYANIEHLHPVPEVFSGINVEIAKSASEFVFGPTRESVKAVTPASDKKAEDLAIIMEARWNEVFSRKEYVAHAKDWEMLSAIANLNLDIDRALTYNLNLEDLDLKHKWSPPIYFIPANLTPFPSGVGFYHDQMILNLNLIDDFDSHIIRPNNK